MRADGNDVIATYQVTRDAVARARRGEGVTLIELMTYRRKGHAEHDNQSYVPGGEIDRLGPRERSARPLRRSGSPTAEAIGAEELAAIDARVQTEIDDATDVAERSPPPEPRDCLVGIYADPPEAPALWYREGIRAAVDRHERPASWGTHDG